MPTTKFNVKSLIRLPDNAVADCILFLSKTQTLHVFGTVSIRTVTGSLSIYGHDLKSDEWYSVCAYFPNVVTLKCNKLSFSGEKASLSNLLRDIYTKDNKVVIEKWSRKLNDAACILLLKSSCSNVDSLFDIGAVLDENNFNKSEKELLEKTSDLNFIVFSDVPPTLSPIFESPDWPDISTFKGKDIPVILVCGGKGVGKSTFGRYVINKVLNTTNHLCFLDTDVGQSEFTPPGILSLNVIDKPIFGPPFSHLSRPKRAFFFGDVTPKDQPNSYVRFIHELFKFYKDNYNGTPILVNTHGWVKGMGIRILLDIIRIVQPTHIIQMNYESEPTKNLQKLNNEILTNEPGWCFWTGNEKKSLQGWKCPHIYQVNAVKLDLDVSKRVNPLSSELRSMSLVSYFRSFAKSSSVASAEDDIINSCPIYSRSMDDLNFYNVSDDVSPNQTLYSINGSIVGLVKVDHEVKVASTNSTLPDCCLSNDFACNHEYVGLGIVRNISPKDGILYIMTPEPAEQICNVNTIVKGRLEIPDTLLKKRKFDTTPYVTSEFTFKHKGSGQKKMRYNLLRQKSKSPQSTETE